MVFQSVNVCHMNCAQVIHMRRQAGQPQIGQAGYAVEVQLNHRGG